MGKIDCRDMDIHPIDCLNQQLKQIRQFWLLSGYYCMWHPLWHDCWWYTENDNSEKGFGYLPVKWTTSFKARDQTSPRVFVSNDLSIANRQYSDERPSQCQIFERDWEHVVDIFQNDSGYILSKNTWLTSTENVWSYVISGLRSKCMVFIHVGRARVECKCRARP